MTIGDTEICIKLLVDKEKNRVLFAECDKDFVDILFSFLTLPIGTIVRLLQMKSEVGCLDALYQSVETLETDFFETEACKAMLLSPTSAVQNKYRNLAINVDDSTDEHVTNYRCPKWSCCTVTHCLLSMVQNAKCLCGEKMGKNAILQKCNLDEKDNLAGVFVKGVRKFIISDDLQVNVVSRETSLSMLLGFGIKDGKTIEERTISVGTEEVLNLLKRCMISKTAMTDVFLLKENEIDMHRMNAETKKIKSELPGAQSDSMKTDLNIVIKKSDQKVLYAVVEKPFLDFLFSFLTLPVGSVEKVLGGYASLGSLDKLYGSVEKLCKKNPEKFKESEDNLINPKIACHHGIENQILQLEAQDKSCATICSCSICFDAGEIDCKHGKSAVALNLINPKCIDVTIKSGGGFVKETAMFMVTDELVVEPLSPISAISFIIKLDISFNDIEERTVSVGEQEALSILRSSLSSKSVFTNAFC